MGQGMRAWRTAVVLAMTGALFGGCGGPTPAGTTDENTDVPPLIQIPNLQNGTATGPKWPDLQPLEAWSLDYPDSTWQVINDETRKDETAPATFTFNGQQFQVQIRKRGQQSWYHPKTSYKVEFPKGTDFEEAREYNLLAEYNDAGNLSDMFTYSLMAAAGVKAPKVRYVTLTVNGAFQGVYTVLEDVSSKSFLAGHGFDPYTSIYRCGERDCEFKITPPAPYQGPWEKKTNETLPNDDLNAFLNALNRVPEHEIEGWLAKNLDLDAYVHTFAVYILINMYGMDDSGSYFLHDFQADKWTFVPWDLNNAQCLFYRDDDPDQQPYWDRPIPIFTAYDKQSVGTYQWKQQKYGNAHLPFSVLQQRVWDRPALRQRIVDYVNTLMATVFSAEQANARVDAQWALIKDAMAKDPWVNQVNARRAPQYLKDYVSLRSEWLKEKLDAELHKGEGGLVFNALGAANGSVADESGNHPAYIELYNRDAKSVDLTGMTISNDLRQQFMYALPGGLTVPPKGKLVLFADGHPELGPAHLPFVIDNKGGELGLYDGKDMVGVKDITYFAPLNSGKEYRRTPDGAETWGWTK